MPAHILIIDDEPNWIDFAAADLDQIFDVELATNLEAVRQKLNEDRYELIIVGSGHSDILKIIREDYPGNRVVVATGQESIREAINVFRLGALDYFAKDFQRNFLSKKVFAVIQKPVKVPA